MKSSKPSSPVQHSRALAPAEAERAAAVEATLTKLREAQSELERRRSEFERLSLLDPLTGVSNRRHFDERAAAERARLAVRPSDFIARLGGEEFALLIPGATPADLRDVAERVRHLIGEAPMATLVAPITVTASFGFTVKMPDEGDITAALNRADDALYRAKRAGRNQVMGDAVKCRFASARDTA